MSLGTGLATLALETLGVFAALALLGAVLGLTRSQLPRLTAAAVAALAVVLALSGLVPSASSLSKEFKGSVGPGEIAAERAQHMHTGMAHCVAETNTSLSLLPFINWLKNQIPARSSYWLARSPQLVDASPGVDPLCVAFELLPRLPLSSMTGAHWVVYTGVLPPALRTRIAAHDPAVRVFSPGYAVVHEGAS